jgi:hypothetical protein
LPGGHRKGIRRGFARIFTDGAFEYFGLSVIIRVKSVANNI